MSSDRKHIITKCCCLQLSPHLSFSAIRAEHWTAPRLLLRVPVVRLVTGLRVPMSHHRHTWPRSHVTRHTGIHTEDASTQCIKCLCRYDPLSRISKSAHYSNTHLHLLSELTHYSEVSQSWSCLKMNLNWDIFQRCPVSCDPHRRPIIDRVKTSS